MIPSCQDLSVVVPQNMGLSCVVVGHGGSVVRVGANDDRVVVGSNPSEAAWKLPLPHFDSVFRRGVKDPSHW